MRFIPNWLHIRLLAYRWYRRKCGIPEVGPEMSAICNEALWLAHEMGALNWNLGGYDWPEPKAGTTVRVRKPNQYVRRVVE
jgi:hypothetical protein